MAIYIKTKIGIAKCRGGVKVVSDDKNYRFGMFYYNKEDDRLFVRNIRKGIGVF